MTLTVSHGSDRRESNDITTIENYLTCSMYREYQSMKNRIRPTQHRFLSISKTIGAPARLNSFTIIIKFNGAFSDSEKI